MTISVEAARHALALALALATPMTGRLKRRHCRSDFGGEDSHLLKVRRIGGGGEPRQPLAPPFTRERKTQAK